MSNFLSFARSFSAMLMAFRSLPASPSFEASHQNRGTAKTQRFERDNLDLWRRAKSSPSRWTRPMHGTFDHPDTSGLASARSTARDEMRSVACHVIRNLGQSCCWDPTWRHPIGFAPQDRRAGAASFRTDEPSKMRLVRTFLTLLPVALILAGGAQSLEQGRFGSAAETHSMARYGEIETHPDERLDETARDRQMEDKESEFDNVMTSACGAGDVFGCGLLLAWRALLAMLQHLLEAAVILGAIALSYRSLILTKVREAIEKLSREPQGDKPAD